MNPNDDPSPTQTKWVNVAQVKKYEIALSEANRFAKKAAAALDKITAGERWGPHCAAAKRASMDLTRALAELRRS